MAKIGKTLCIMRLKYYNLRWLNLATFPLGTTTGTLVVNDGTDDSVPDTVDITGQDTTSPEVTISSLTATDYLHSDTLIIDFNVTDTCSGVASATLDGSSVSDG